MAPSRKPLKNKKKKLDHRYVKTMKETNLSKLCSDDLKKKDEISSIGCTTPKAQRYKIPAILTCPPAPKKRRLVASCTLRRPISFFDPPDIELFFASHLTSIYNHVHTHASINYGIQEGACVPNSL
ncbi:hypothetical protein L1987_10467 [Smallanthus sonchifolius]|uniref:Uncharacterized protein n=1 Tax=Smallanthus sonchifolius TaxID=185202 RepID=A0ACB9JS71_9ASTR|nr:hypothetical protein L1987_10467 [Smallanthus sonchifolius]